MQIYNTLTRQKEEFNPADPPNVLFYNCGPTVYDYFHIGNARNFVIADTIRRYLAYRGYKVTFVQNLTDVDDKIIKKANEEGVSASEIADKYTKIFFEQCNALGIQPADQHPKATESIHQMQEMIKTLIDKGHAYEVEGDVYFSVRSFPGYGELSHKNPDDLREGARVEVNAKKKDPLDFALWKAAKPGEPSWDSPWGKGRPGWHIECSAMATSRLAETIDIHSGGVDLIFPHHENERAQSQAATGKPFVKYWLHNGFLNIDSRKMSKSLGNFFTINEVLDKYDPLTVKFFLLSAHYRHPLDFTEENMEAAKSASRRILDSLATADKVLQLEPVGADETPAAPEDTEKGKSLRDSFKESMDDDFNTARALGVIHDVATSLHEVISRLEETQEKKSKKIFASSIIMYRDLLKEMLGILGLDPSLSADEVSSNEMSGKLIELLIELRSTLRDKKEYALADKIRDRLDDLGIILEDRPQGTIWKKR